MLNKPTIGLEIHAELNTATKMFCDCLNRPEETPNSHTCPVCLAHPGTLPVPNKKAVESVLRVGLALGGSVADISKFDRKNYFYPDLPKGYQISQYDQPLITGGQLCGVRIRRIHLEEDTGTLTHDSKDGSSMADFNRAGVPLMELVTEPDVVDGEHCAKFAREFQQILRYLGVSDADMEKGQMRIEANVSWDMGTKTELKNINSFRAVMDAVAYEIERQKEALEKGEKLVQETRGWDEAKRKTFSQRIKEEAHDYRYFPEPDIPPFVPAEIFDLDEMRASLPELPLPKKDRFMREYGLNEKQADFLTSEKELADWFENAISELLTRDDSSASFPEKKPLELMFNYFSSDLMGLMKEAKESIEDIKINPANFAALVDMIADNKINSRQAKDVLGEMFKTGEDPAELIQSMGLESITDEGAILEVVRSVISNNPKPAEDFKSGKEAALMFLVGSAMRELKGRASPEILKDLFRKEISSS